MSNDARAAADAIAQRAPGFSPRVGIVLGSGLGGLADAVERAVAIDYADLAGFPRPGVDGHAGRLVLGTLGGTDVACMQGRPHLYEGHAPAALAAPIRALRRAGCEILVLTNAAGSLRADMGPGSLMMLTDHINMTGLNPLAGPNDDAVGPRFPDMSQAYDPELARRLAAHAVEHGIELHQGVYLACLGPSFETPAEIAMFRTLGADAVGMSTVPECLVANHCGLRVAAISIITNLAAGMTDAPLSHDETLAEAAKAAGTLQRLVVAFVSGLGDAPALS